MNYIKYCITFPEEDKENHPQKFLEERKGKGGDTLRVNENIGNSKPQKAEELPFLFAGVLGSKYSDRMCAENGADRNILNKETLRRIGAAGVEFGIG